MDVLDKVLEVFISDKAHELGEKVNAGLRDEFCNTIREKTREQIVEEIKQHYTDEIVAQAEKEINRKEQEKRLKEMKSLLWQGFFVAMCVGLFVNQVTDVISFYKGISSLKQIYPTMLICLLLFVVCISMYIITFAKQFMDFFKEKR